MANNQGFINTSELDMQSYRDSLRQFLRQQTNFADYDFDGSNLSVLLDLLAYNSYNNALYLNMIGSEMFLDSAELRDSIVSHAKELNYVPRSRSSSVVYLDVSVNPAPDSPDTITIPKHYRITGRDSDGSTFYFNTNEATVLRKADGWAASEIPFYEGIILREAFIAGDGDRFVLQSANVDISSIDVIVQTSNNDTTQVPWTRESTLFGLSGTSKAFFVEGAEDFKYQIVFGNGTVGKQLDPGNIVFVTYRQTLGDLGNGVKSFTTPRSIDGYSNITLTPQLDSDLLPITSNGGAMQEETADIKFNAPRYFSTQGRAINANDYEILIKNQFPFIQAVTAYGGEEATPKRYGKAIVSAKPFNGSFIPDSIKSQMLGFLKNKASLSIEPIFVDPEYLYVDIETDVKYNVNATTKTRNEIISLVTTAIVNFNTSALSNFGSDLAYSKLGSAIDDSDISVSSNNTKVRISKRLKPTALIAFNTTFSYENALSTSGSTRYEIKDGETPVIISSPFVYGGFTSYIRDNGIGTLQIYTNSKEGAVNVLNKNIGSVNYDTGDIVITNLVVDSVISGAYIKLYAIPKSNDIETKTNKILLIEQADVKINAVGVRM